jgi:hypothetical protein
VLPGWVFRVDCILAGRLGAAVEVGFSSEDEAFPEIGIKFEWGEFCEAFFATTEDLMVLIFLAEREDKLKGYNGRYADFLSLHLSKNYCVKINCIC